MKAGERRVPDKAGAKAAAEKRKASARAKAAHPLLYVKRHFGYAKMRYRGLAKNTQRIAGLLGLANPLIAGRYATARRGTNPCATAARRGRQTVGSVPEIALYRQDNTTPSAAGASPTHRTNRTPAKTLAVQMFPGTAAGQPCSAGV